MAIKPHGLRHSNKSYIFGRRLKKLDALHQSDFIVMIKDGIRNQDASWTKVTRQWRFEEKAHPWESDIEQLRQSAIRQVQNLRENSLGPIFVAEKVSTNATRRLRVCGTYPSLAKIAVDSYFRQTQLKPLVREQHSSRKNRDLLRTQA